MSKQEIAAEFDRCMAMSQPELEAHLMRELDKPGAAATTNEALDFIIESLKNGTLVPAAL